MFIIVLVRNLIKDENIGAQKYIDNPLLGYYFDSDTKIQIEAPPFAPESDTKWLGLSQAVPFASCLAFGLRRIGYVGSYSNDLKEYLKKESKFFASNSLVFDEAGIFDHHIFNSEQEMENKVKAQDYAESTNPGLCVGIVITGRPGDYKVRLRFDDNDLVDRENRRQQVPNTREPIVNDLEKRPYEIAFQMYHTSGFTYLEYIIARFLAEKDGGKDVDPETKVGMLAMQTDDYKIDAFLSGAGEFLGFFVVLCYLPPIFRIVTMLVQDKELKTREGMNMMGLKDSAYWLSFFLYYVIIFFVLALLLSTIVVIFLFTNSNWFITVIYYFLYGLSVFSFGFFISTFFSRTRVACITATMIYFASSLISDLVSGETASESSKTAASLLPPVAASLGSVAYVNYETGGSGVSFGNARRLVNNYRFSTALMMFVIDAVIYGILGLYLDNVIPNANGVSKPLYFFLTKQFWTGNYEGKVGSSDKENDSEEKVLYPNNKFQVVGEELKAQEERSECLSIRHLNKYFGHKHAVVDFSVNMHRGQIFALLGPNGAGKTTTLSMLCGLLPASTGSASFAGMAIFREMAKVREKLGVCPQHDVLFELLTPKEHLEIFAAFKGREDKESINKDVEDILEDIELKNCDDMLASNLSGGQRRKLSIAIAFIGNCDMIFLDEPTSGIDLATRKRVWAILKKYKDKKVIILTTHYMEEAEELGDRIGIMTSGKLRCVGSPLFLKSIYGAGYNLLVAHEKTQQLQELHENITSFVTNHIEGSHVRKEAEKEITYFLPRNQSPKFKNFFIELDKNLEKLKIESYGMRTNTMEEIFLKVAREDDGEREGQKLNPNMYSMSMSKSVAQTAEDKDLDTYSIANEDELPFFDKFVLHSSAILKKRWIINFRNIGTIITEILVPMILIVFGLALTKISTFEDSKARIFDHNAYGIDHYVIVNDRTPEGRSTNEFTKYFSGSIKLQNGVKYTTSSGPDDKKNLETFDDYVHKNSEGVERYGSLFINRLHTSSDENLYQYVVLGNMASQDVAGAFMGYFSEILYRSLKEDETAKLTYITAPLPLTAKARNLEQAIKGSIVANTLVIAFALVPAGIISFIVQEREGSLKHQQLISGVSLAAYWLSNGLIDIFKSLIPCGFGIGMIYAFGSELPFGWLFILLYAFSIIPFTYSMSFLFIKENSAQTAILLFNFFAGVVLSPVFNILRAFDNTRSAGKVLAWILRIFPSFSLANGITNVSLRNLYAVLEGVAIKPYMHFSVAGGDAMFLGIAFPIYLIIICLIEAQFFNFLALCCEPKSVEDTERSYKDEFVLNEEKICDSMVLDKDPPAVLTKHIRKVYSISSKESIRAVRDLSFYVKKGECLAILGTAGAGKTTTFKLITHDILPTRGEIFVDGLELEHNFPKIRRMFGYGPQYESTYMSMTVRENLEYYAKIKGIPENLREKMIVKLINEMDLIKYEHVQVGQLSGGNKRKTTVAVALLGNPPIVLLDEPSTGVDPQAKRFMWHIIQRISTKNKKTAVLLTTHSMEEAEYLSTKMAIMIGGEFNCIGTAQQLKDRYGKGFEVQISLPHPKCEEEEKCLSSLGIASTAKMNLEEVKQVFRKINRPELEEELKLKGNAAHIDEELKRRGEINARVVANFIILEEQFMNIAKLLAEEFGEVKVPEHIGNFFKFKINKSKPTHTIGFLFGMLQDIVTEYNITQYAASQTSLNQIFQSLVKQSEVLLLYHNSLEKKWGR